MLPNRLHISQQATNQLKAIKSRTGVTPNILCRIALALSLEENFPANTENTDIKGAEFNLSTLLGDTGVVFEALLKQAHGNLSPKQAELMLAAHIDNGVDKIKRSKSILDLMSFES